MRSLQEPARRCRCARAPRGVSCDDVGDVDVLEVAHDAGSSSAAARFRLGLSLLRLGFVGDGAVAVRSLGTSGCGSERSTVLPSASTTSAWSIRNASALPRAMSERTASRTPRRSRSLRTFGRLLVHLLGQAVDLGVDLVVGRRDLLLGDHRAQREVGAHRLGGADPHAVDELLLVLAGRGEVLRDRHARCPAPRAGARGRGGGAPSRC